MKPQMIRKQYLMVAETLLEALMREQEQLEALSYIYELANRHFASRENDIDPTAIVLGMQATSLACRTTYNWLEAVSHHTSTLYYLRGQEVMEQVEAKLDSLGITMPDALTL